MVCPAIDESESISAATAVAEAERLQAGPFRDARVAVAHGQLKSADRDEVMRAFKSGELDVLVATSLIEVGIDVPNATVMIVEGAERFGLAQLHQLRGRVGRGSEKSYCLLFADAETGSSQARLEALLETNDGFELADKDLEIRGEGQVMGSRQAGVPDLKLARLARDREALLRARELAAEHPRRRPRPRRPRQRAAQGRGGGRVRARARLAAQGLSRRLRRAPRVYCRPCARPSSSPRTPTPTSTPSPPWSRRTSCIPRRRSASAEPSTATCASSRRCTRTPSPWWTRRTWTATASAG